MHPADFGAVTHQHAYLVQRFALHGKLASEGVAVVQARPGQAGLGVGGGQGVGEVVTWAFRPWEEVLPD